MKTIRVTTAEAIVRWLIAQRTTIDGTEQPVFPGVFAIFGHGNVTSLGHALQRAGDELPTWRGQNEQGMALAAVGYAKAVRRRQIMVATSSIGPGATNMVTAAGVALANRLPVLLLAGDTFSSRGPDPVLQQVEHFGDPTVTVNDAFRPVVRYWDRIVRPSQILESLPRALAMMLDPGDCGPAFLALPQDVQAEAFDAPAGFFDPVVHTRPRPRADRDQLTHAADVLRSAEKPLIVAGGGVHYSGATSELAAFAAAHGIPVVETMAGRASLRWGHHCYAGPIGVTGSDNANRLAAEADVVLAVGTRLADFTTGSWSVFAREGVRLIGLNAARFDAGKHHALPLVGDARETLVELDVRLSSWTAPSSWLETAGREVSGFLSAREVRTRPPGDSATLPTYAQVVGAVNRKAVPGDYVVAAAGGLPGELNGNWATQAVGDFDCEYGYSCMGYEISGAWGARMARPEGEVFAFVGDGSYLMMNSDLYSSVLSGHRLTVIVCDNGGYAVIDRLQRAQGGASFNNQLDDCRTVGPPARRRADRRADQSSTASGCGAAATVWHEGGDLSARVLRRRAERRAERRADQSSTASGCGEAATVWHEGGDLSARVPRVDFVAHARSLGCAAEGVTTIAELEGALERARAAMRTTVIVIATHPDAWTEGGAFWEVGVPEVSETEAVRTAREAMVEAKQAQRTGW